MEIWKEFKRTQRTTWEVSNYGKIRGNGEIKKIPINKKGYLQASNLGYVHKIVAENFIENPEMKSQVNHKDGNKLNNHVNNLEWTTCKENIEHAWKNKLNIASKGSKNGASKLIEAQVLEIKKLFSQGVKSIELAKIFFVSERTIGRILSGESWKHLN